MIVYNETIIMDEAIYEEWLSWMKAVYLPAVLQTEYFDSAKLLNIIDSPNEGITVCAQFNTDNIERYSLFTLGHRQQLQEMHRKQFENKFVLFSTLMQTID
jgi:hypothetical protein